MIVSRCIVCAAVLQYLNDFMIILQFFVRAYSITRQCIFDHEMLLHILRPRYVASKTPTTIDRLYAAPNENTFIMPRSQCRGSLRVQFYFLRRRENKIDL